jgi:hypothetical protein
MLIQTIRKLCKFTFLILASTCPAAFYKKDMCDVHVDAVNKMDVY